MMASLMARRDPQTLEHLLPRVLARLAGQSGKGRALSPVWSAAVGPHIAKHTRPHTLEGGTLVVLVANAEWAHTLSRQEASLREQLNARLGADPVSALVFRLEE
jgi:predicted nucleic acid-binding Zn ribbon protein